MDTTWDRVLAWRMRRQFLADPAAVDPGPVARRLAGVQAQVPASADAAVAVRRATRRGDTAAALAERTLVRTWAMRGTLHLLPTDVAPAYLSLLAAARSWEKGAWQREFATAEQIERLAAAAGAALSATPLTREELVAALTDEADLTAKLTSGWSALLKPLAWQGVLCQGPPVGSKVTFVDPSAWLPGWPPSLPDPDEAARTVVGDYLGAHGPASAAAFDAWLLRGALPRTRLRGWFADLVDDGTLSVVDVEGEALYARTVDLDELARAAPVAGVRLLPGFDQYVLGPGTADTRVLPGEHRGRVSRAAGWIAPVVVRAGRVVGTWDLDGDVLRVEPFDAATDLPGLDDEVRTWSTVLGRELTARV